MVNVIKTALLSMGKKVILSMLTERVLKKVIIALLREGAKKTKWDLDDEIVDEIEKALK